MVGLDVGFGHQRLLYPELQVVTEDYVNDLLVVTSSKSFDIMSAFRKTEGQWHPSRLEKRYWRERGSCFPPFVNFMKSQCLFGRAVCVCTCVCV